MALSGSVVTSSWYSSGNKTRNYTLSWTATQSITGNYSDVSWTLSATGTYDPWVADRTLNVTINGTTVFSKTDRVERYPGVIATSKSPIRIYHNSNGSKTFTVTVNAAVYDTTVNCTGSKTFTLDTIPRTSTISVGTLTMGTASTITVTKGDSSFTHDIDWEFKNSSYGQGGTICIGSSATSVSWTPSLDMAKVIPAATTGTGTLTCTTYLGDTQIGSTSIPFTINVPTSVVPSCTLTVSDSTGYSDTYGGYIKGVSKLAVTVNPTLAYNSAIASYSTTIDGNSYTSKSFTSGAIKSSGDLTISTKVTDMRGRSGTAETTVNVLDYNKPAITLLKVKRCDADGTDNDQGDCVQITFSASISPIDNKNTAAYTIEAKKSSDTSYTTIVEDGWQSNYEMTNQTYIFAADSGSSYDIKLTAEDAFDSVSWSTVVSTAATIMHFPSNGIGMGIGKVVENEGYFELNYPAEFYKNAHFKEHLTYDIPVCNTGYDLDTMVISGRFYMGNDAANKPSNNNGWLDVQSYSSGLYCFQTYTTYLGERYHRIRVEGEWSEWEDETEVEGDYLPLSGGTLTGPLTLGNATPGSIYMTNASGTARNALHLNSSNSLNLGYGGWSASEGLTNVYGNEVKITSRNTVTVNGFSIATNKVLWSGASHMNGSQTITLSEGVDKQAYGIVLIFSFYNSSSSAAEDHDFSMDFVPKYFVSTHSAKGASFTYMPPGYESGYTGTKYLYISNTSIKGYANNTLSATGTNGIVHNNAQRVLRYVIGV